MGMAQERADRDARWRDIIRESARDPDPEQDARTAALVQAWRDSLAHDPDDTGTPAPEGAGRVVHIEPSSARGAA